MAQASTFWLRFGFARWLRHLETGEPPGYAEIGRALPGKRADETMTGQGVSGWKDRIDAPLNYFLHKPLSTFLGVPQPWLIDGEGDPPRPDLWEVWYAARQGKSQMRPGAFLPDPRLDRKLSPEEEQRALRVAEEEQRAARAARKKPVAGKRSGGGA